MNAKNEIAVIGAGFSGLIIGCELLANGINDFTIYEKGSEKFEVVRLKEGDEIYRGEKIAFGLGGSGNIWSGIISSYSCSDFEDLDEFLEIEPFFSQTFRILGVPHGIQETLEDNNELSFFVTGRKDPVNLLLNFYGRDIIQEVLRHIQFNWCDDTNGLAKISNKVNAEATNVNWNFRFLCTGLVSSFDIIRTVNPLVEATDLFFHAAEKDESYRGTAQYPLIGSTIVTDRTEKRIPIKGGFLSKVITRSKLYKNVWLREVLSLLAIIASMIITPSFRKTGRRYYIPLRRSKIQFGPNGLQSSVKTKFQGEFKTHPGLHFSNMKNRKSLAKVLSKQKTVLVSPLMTSYRGVHTTTPLTIALALKAVKNFIDKND